MLNEFEEYLKCKSESGWLFRMTVQRLAERLVIFLFIGNYNT